DVETIATIAVLPGPAASALYGTGAANGVLLITTKRGAPGKPRLHAFTSQGLSAQPLDFPANYSAVDSTGAACSSVGVASGACRLSQSNVFAGPPTSPFRHGYVRQYGLSASGGTTAVRYALHGQWDGLGGVYGLPALEAARLAAGGGLHPEVLNPNYLRRVAFRGTGQVFAGACADLAVALGYFTGDLRLPMNDTANYGLLLSGLLGGNAAGGWLFPPGDILQVTSLQHVERLNGTVTGTWRPLVPFSVRAVIGVERTEQQDDRQQRPGEGPFGNPAFSASADGHVHNNRLTGTLVATTAFTPWSAVSLRTTVGVHYYRRAFKWAETSASRFGSVGSSSSSLWLDTVATTGLFLAQEIAVHDRLVATSALRRDVTTRVGGTTDPAVLYPQVGLSWRGPVPENAPWITSWRLRAAYGAVGGEHHRHFQGVTQLVLPGPAVVVFEPERTREIEGGLDAELLRGRVAFRGTVYDRRTTHVFWALTFPTISGYYPADNSRVVSNKGVEFALNAALLGGPAATWSIGVSAWGNRNRVV
ncbi:MAG TPA: hypothetical protein VHQ03_08470, partial [Candidatus Dormibacteraeota bacterium]|nr:hypothetical protein [Candidatus Dormibacteraeota bacterium]